MTITSLPTPDTATKLYRLTSVIDNWPHRNARYDGVKVTWLVDSRTYDPGFDYRALLGRPLPKGEGKSYTQGIVDELFTRDEADQLAAYLRTPHGDLVTITEQAAPIRTRDTDGVEYMPYSAIPVGGPSDFYMLSRHEDYALPFNVSGYYDVEDKHPAKIRACTHECEHHERIDAYVDYTPPTVTPTPVAVSDGEAPF